MDFTNPSVPKNTIKEIEPPVVQNQQPTNLGVPPKKRKRLFIFGGIFIILGILIAGGVWAYTQGYLPLPFLMPKVNEVLAKTFETISELKTARYAVEFQINAQNKEEGVEPLDLDILENTNTNSSTLNKSPNETSAQLFNLVPTDLDLQFQISGIYNKEQKSENESNLSGHYASSGTTMAIDLSLKKIEENYYVLINKFPSLFFIDVSPYSEKWIVVSPEDTGTPFDALFKNKSFDESADIPTQIHKAIELALKHKVITLDSKKKTETIDGYKTYKINLILSREDLPAFYKELADTLSSEYGDKALIKYDEKTAAKLTETNFKYFFDYWNKNSTITIWVDSRQGIPRKISWENKMAPPPTVTKFKDKELKTTVTFTFKDINEPVKIEKPKDVVSWDEIDRQARGITEGEQKVEKQYNRISTLKSTLRYYKDLFNEYPESFEEMRAARDKEPTNELSKNRQKYFQSSLDRTNTTDIFTGEEYSYQIKDKGYEFTYQISFEDVRADKKEELPYNYFVEGTNTTNEGYNLSLEKGPVTTTPIRDPFEELKKKDTDDDGFDDKTEIDSGYNPNGSGKLELETI